VLEAIRKGRIRKPKLSIGLNTAKYTSKCKRENTE
jgi:hypothetical protein